jgi:hypothetical protein
MGAPHLVLGTVSLLESLRWLIAWNSTFTSWNPSPDVKEGSTEYYSRQVYSHGTRCWNGPERNVKVWQVPLPLYCGSSQRPPA